MRIIRLLAKVPGLGIGRLAGIGRRLRIGWLLATVRGSGMGRLAATERGLKIGRHLVTEGGFGIGRFAATEWDLRVGRLLMAGLLTVGSLSMASGQEIRSHYVSKAETDGTIYHTFPVTLFEHPEAGDLTFDITYKEHRGGRATLNFTCHSSSPDGVDSVRFVSGSTVLSGPVEKLYLEPERRGWKHRYTFDLDASLLCGFFDERQQAEAMLYIGGIPRVYRVKRSAWRSYAPIGYRIFEMIRVNERQ